MTSVSGVAASTKPAASRQTDLLKVKVTENDPGLKVSATAFGFRIAGTGTNNGIVKSSLKLQFDGKSVTLDVRRGDTSQHMLAKLNKALPKGYEARVLQSFRNMPPELVIGISKKGAAKAPTTAQLKGALEDISNNSLALWSDKKPAGAVAKSIVIQKAPTNWPGYQVTAHVMKSDPTKFYFERTPRIPAPRPGGPTINPPPGGFRTTYFGPTSLEQLNG